MVAFAAIVLSPIAMMNLFLNAHPVAPEKISFKKIQGGVRCFASATTYLGSTKASQN
jgi:hypothetical protein